MGSQGWDLIFQKYRGKGGKPFASYIPKMNVGKKQCQLRELAQATEWAWSRSCRQMPDGPCVAAGWKTTKALTVRMLSLRVSHGGQHTGAKCT